jgi:alkylhydroperoxidase/carboxymuconolactone decarboxylase family protein YurZ
MKKKTTRTPRAHREFVRRFPGLGRAWEIASHAGLDGPLDEKTSRLVKLGIALGSLREGAVHSAVRKAVAAGVSARELEQVVALAATTLGFPATVAVDSWIHDLAPARVRTGRSQSKR